MGDGTDRAAVSRRVKIGLAGLGTLYLGLALLTTIIEIANTSSIGRTTDLSIRRALITGYFTGTAAIPLVLAGLVTGGIVAVSRRKDVAPLFLRTLLYVLLALVPLQGASVLVGLGRQVLSLADEGAHQFESPEGRFKVTFPGPPEHTQRVIDPDTATTMNSFTANDGGVVFIAMYFDTQADASARPPSARLESARASLLSKPGRVLVAERPITLGSYPGREYEVEEGRTRVHLRVFLVGSRVYELIVAGKDSDRVKARRSRFFESFSVFE